MGILSKPLIPHIPASVIPGGVWPTTEARPGWLSRALGLERGRRPPCLSFSQAGRRTRQLRLGWERSLQGSWPHSEVLPAAPSTRATAGLFRAGSSFQEGTSKCQFPWVPSSGAPRRAQLKSWLGSKSVSLAQLCGFPVCVPAWRPEQCDARET